MRIFRRRTARYILIGVFLSAVAGWGYLQTPHAKKMVLRNFQQQIRMPVAADQVSIGISSIEFRNLTLHEIDGQGKWLQAPRMVVHYPVWDMLIGRTAKKVVVENADVHLRFNKAGDLLTRFPDPAGENTPRAMPNLQLRDARVTVEEEGRSPNSFENINLELVPTDGHLTLSGAIRDPRWGHWTVQGDYELATHSAKLLATLQGEHAVTPELLRKTPFVNQNAWQAIDLSGSTTAKLEVQYDGNQNRASYLMTMRPKEVQVHVPAIHLNFSGASGLVQAYGQQLRLTDISGEAAGGKVKLNAEMDFSGWHDTLRFTTQIQQAALTELPKEWRFPKEVTGKVDAQTDFTVTILRQGGVQTDGRGQATIHQANLNGVPTQPIHLQMQPANGGEFQFVQVIGQPGQPNPLPNDLTKPATPVGKKGLLTRVLRQVSASDGQPLPVGVQRKYLQVNTAFRNINLDELLQALKVNVQVPLRGKVDAEVKLEIPSDDVTEFRNYRVEGKLTSPTLEWEGFKLINVSCNIKVDRGTLFISDLVATVPKVGLFGKTATITGNGQIQLVDEQLFEVKLQVNRLSISQLEKLSMVGELPISLSGEWDISARLHGSMAAGTFFTEGEATCSKVRVKLVVPIDDIRLKWKSDLEQINLQEIALKAFGGTVSGETTIPLSPAAEGKGVLQIKQMDLGKLSLVTNTLAKITMAGVSDGTITIRVPKVVPPQVRGYQVDLQFDGPKLTIQGLPADKVRANAVIANGVADYKVILKAFGGEVELNGRLDPNSEPQQPQQAPPQLMAVPGFPYALPIQQVQTNSQNTKLKDPLRLKLRGINLSELLKISNKIGGVTKLDAEISGELTIREIVKLEIEIPQKDGTVVKKTEERYVGEAALRIDRLHWQNQTISSSGTALVKLTEDEIFIDKINLPVGRGSIRASGVINLDRFDASRMTLNLTKCSTEKALVMVPSLEKNIRTTVDGRINLSVGSEIRGNGVLFARGGTIYGVPVTDLRLPLDFTYSLVSNRGELHFRDANGSTSGGRISGKGELRFPPNLHPTLKLNLEGKNIDIGKAFASAQQYSAVVSGKLELTSRSLDTVNDLDAKFDGTIGRSRPFGLPLLSSLVPFLGFGRDTTTLVEGGEVSARLHKSVWKFDEVTLTGSSLDIYATGEVSLNGNIRAEIAGSTGQARLNLLQSARIQRLSTRTVNEPFTAEGLSNVFGVLANFAVHLEVSGTVTSPVIRIETVKTLSDNAIRFLLLRLAPVR
ncbi:MAG: hypothetical protein R3B84_12980 [Zavarzinella sp.]